MYRQVDVHYVPQTIVFWRPGSRLRMHHPGRASSYRLAVALHKANVAGVLETRCPGSSYLGVVYKVWDAKPKC